MLYKLLQLAKYLDTKGFAKEADIVDDIMLKAAEIDKVSMPNPTGIKLRAYKAYYVGTRIFIPYFHAPLELQKELSKLSLYKDHNIDTGKCYGWEFSNGNFVFAKHLLRKNRFQLYEAEPPKGDILPYKPDDIEEE